MSAVPDITLNNGVTIPQLGFGVWQIERPQAKDAVLAALEVGYRHIDTAQGYHNEKEVGEAVRASGLPREEVFVTSKLNNNRHAYDDALKAFEETLAALDLGYLDLFLIHWPQPAVGDYVETWRAMEEMLGSGRVRAIGVSNFQISHLQRILSETTVTPAVNQIEGHPYLTNDAVREFNDANAIVTEAWSPIAQGLVLDDPVIKKVAETHGKTPAQVTLRWHIERGDVIFPKSVTRSRIEENFQIFDFALSADEVGAISALNRGHRTGPDPDTFN